MKTNFKVLSLAAMALVLGLSSCDKGGVPEGFKKVKVQMEFPAAKTRAMDGTTADGKSPNFVDLTLFFVGNGTVQQVEPITLSGGTSLTESFTVPNAVSKVYAIGNTGDGVLNNEGVGAPTTLPTVGDGESTVKGLAMELDKQLGYKIVNLSNGQGANGTAYGGAGSTMEGTTETYTFTVSPAFARYEIKQVSAKSDADKLLASFKLTGIFITNTYRTIGLDYETVGGAINYASNTASFATDIPSYLRDVYENANVTAGTQFIPNNFDNGISATDGFWWYMVSPVIKENGTTLVGGSAPESSIPIIVLRIENAVAGAGNNDTYVSPSYITIRTLTASSGKLESLKPGYVYKIADIAFGGEHLTTRPGESTESDIAVKVTFQPWTGEDVTPGW